MKKYILLLILIFTPILIYSNDYPDNYNSVETPWKYDFTKGLSEDHHIPTCHMLSACPVCRMNGSFNNATKKCYGEDEKGKYVKYICEGGHQCYFYYKLVKNPNYPSRNRMVKEYLVVPIEEGE